MGCSNSSPRNDASTSAESVLIIGSTGNVGSATVRALTALSDAPRVTVFVRDSSKARAKELFGDSVHYATAPDSFEGDSVGRLVRSAIREHSVTRVFLVPATNPRISAWNAGIAKAVGSEPSVTQLLLLSGRGASLDAPTDSLFRWHAESERAVIATNPPALAILRPNDFMQNLLEPGTVAMVKHESVLARYAGISRLASIDVRDIARAAATVLTQPPAKHAGHTYLLDGPQLETSESVVKDLQAVLQKDIHLAEMEPFEFFQALSQAVGEQFAFVLYRLYQHIDSTLQYSATARPSADFQILTGKKPTSQRQFLEDHKALFA